jgi:uncharacterized protein (TIGR03435 family)
MIQRLLAERLGLVVHHEAREQTVYEMAIAKGGLKLKDAEPAPASGPPPDPAAAADGRPPTIHLGQDKNGNPQLPPGRPLALVMSSGGVVRVMARMQSMSAILDTLERHISHPVVDKSGLTGKYNYTLEYASVNAPSVGMAPTASPDALPGGGAAPGNAAPNDASIPAAPFLVAVEQQFGLKLVPTKAPVDTLFVDSFHKLPVAN